MSSLSFKKQLSYLDFPESASNSWSLWNCITWSKWCTIRLFPREWYLYLLFCTTKNDLIDVHYTVGSKERIYFRSSKTFDPRMRVVVVFLFVRKLMSTIVIYAVFCYSPHINRNNLKLIWTLHSSHARCLCISRKHTMCGKQRGSFLPEIFQES